MNEIAEQMVQNAKRKLASAGLSEEDKSYAESVLADFDESSPKFKGRIQEATRKPATHAAPATPSIAQVETFFGRRSDPGRLTEEERRFFVGRRALRGRRFPRRHRHPRYNRPMPAIFRQVTISLFQGERNQNVDSNT